MALAVRPLHAPRAAGPGRHGRGLPREDQLVARLREDPRHQAHPAAPRGGRDLRLDVHRRGEAHGAAHAPEDRPDPRLRRRWRAVLHRLEFVDGSDALGLLRTSAQRRLHIPRHLAVFIINEVLEALDYAHNARDMEGKTMHIVHRDISPSNIFLSKRGDVKLGDFGIAHAQRRESKTQAGTLKGKYGYMSPEQVVGQQVDGRSDLFAVGVVLAEMLMGRRLFTAPNDLDVLLMVRDARIERLSTILPRPVAGARSHRAARAAEGSERALPNGGRVPRRARRLPLRDRDARGAARPARVPGQPATTRAPRPPSASCRTRASAASGKRGRARGERGAVAVEARPTS